MSYENQTVRIVVSTSYHASNHILACDVSAPRAEWASLCRKPAKRWSLKAAPLPLTEFGKSSYDCRRCMKSAGIGR